MGPLIMRATSVSILYYYIAYNVAVAYSIRQSYEFLILLQASGKWNAGINSN